MVRFNKELSITRSSPMKVFHEDELHTAILKKNGINRDSNNSFVRRKANLLIMK